MYPFHNDFNEVQLIQTLRHAASHPFYKDHWSGWTGQEVSTDAYEAILHLPPTTKDHLRNFIKPLLRWNDEIQVVHHTSGTTGSMVYRYRSRSEVNAVIKMISEVMSLTEASGLQPLAMMFVNPYHGTPFPIPGRGLVFDGGVFDDVMIEQTISILQKRFDMAGFDERVRVLTGTLNHVRMFTLYLSENGIESRDFALEKIFVFGGFMSNAIRHLLIGYWGFEPSNRFSASEMFGGGNICPRCGFINFDPHLYPQVLSLEDHSPIGNGTGLLALTELLPFGSCQPLIKYLTGDIVEWTVSNRACPSHVVGLRHLGRVENSHIIRIDGVQRVILSASILYNVVDRPEVEKTPKFPQILRISDHRLLGFPIAGSGWNRSTSPPTLEVRFKPSNFTRWQDTCTSINKELLKTSEWLEIAINSKAISLSVIPDTKLAKPLVMKEA